MKKLLLANQHILMEHNIKNNILYNEVEMLAQIVHIQGKTGADRTDANINWWID